MSKKRRIYFYKSLFLDNSNSTVPNGNPRTLTAQEVEGIFRNIQSLHHSESANPNAYMTVGSNITVVKIFEIANGVVCGHLARKRKEDLPHLEEEGKLEKLKLGPNQGVYEPAHFVLFPNRQHLALEMNIHAPRVETLRDYILDKARNPQTNLDDVQFIALIRGNVIDLVQQMGSIAQLQVEILRDAIDQLDEGKLGKSLRQLREFTPLEMDVIELRLARRKRSRSGGLTGNEKNDILNWLRRFLGVFTKASIKVESAQDDSKSVLLLDLLKDRYIKTVNIPYSEGYVDTKKMFERIMQAYEEFLWEFTPQS